MEGKTEAFRRGVKKRLNRQPIPLWTGKLIGKGFYVVHRRYKCSTPSVQKGVVGEVILSGFQVDMEGPRLMTKKFQADMLKNNRKQLVVRVNLYKPPFDIIKHKYSDYYGIHSTGYLGTYSLDELFVTRREAYEKLKSLSKE